MKALCWYGKSDIRCDTVPDLKIESAFAICGSDLHIFNGVIPEMKSGDASSATKRWAGWLRSAPKTRN